MAQKRTYNLFLLIMVILFMVILFLIVYFNNTALINKSTPRGATGLAIGNFSVSVTTYLACGLSNDAADVNFGSNLNPGVAYQNATKNYAGTDQETFYNVSVTLSNVNANITILGSNLSYGSNVLAVGNVSWASNSTNA